MISFGQSSGDDGLIHVSRLPVFVSAAASLVDSQAFDTRYQPTDLYSGANPFRILLAFLSSLNTRDREAFRLLAGIEQDKIFRVLDSAGLRNPALETSDSRQPGSEYNGAGLVQAIASGAPVTRPSRGGLDDLLVAERLLFSWRSSRLRSAKLQPGSLAHTAARSEAGKHLAELLETESGSLLFQTGWAGERFAQDAQRDLGEAWSAVGRAVAIEMRREAAPWLARSLGSTNVPSFSLEYTVRPSPSNAYMALLSLRAIVAGVTYGIPYQVAARALDSAAALYFGGAPLPMRYVEEPLPGLKVYVPRDTTDSAQAIAELYADLSATYPSAMQVPPALLYFSVHAEADFNEICIALDGAFREAAAGATLARSFMALLRTRGFQELASLVHLSTPGSTETGASLGYD